MASLTVVSAPSVRAVEVEELSNFLKLPDIPDDDARLSILIDAAIAVVEADLNRATINRQVMETVRRPKRYGVFQTSLAPVVSVSEITVDGEVVSEDDYNATADTDDGFIDFIGSQLPRVASKMQVTYIAGYGETATDVPAAIRYAILIEAARAYGEPVERQAARLAPFRRYFF